MKLYVVGKVLNPRSLNCWEFCGIYDNEELATKYCKTPSHFIGPVNLNEELPEETKEWPNSYYPLSKNE